MNTHCRPAILRVVVADDHLEMRQAIERLLQGRFDVVQSVSNGQALVEAALASRPDVIVSDVRMPRLSGVEAMRMLQNRGTRVPFVLVSAETVGAQEWIELGATCVVHKMDLETDLESAVQAAADGEAYISRTAIGE